MSAVRALRLRRRDDVDLALMRVDQMERDGVVVDFTARLLASLVRTQPVDVVWVAVRDALPWTTFLPEHDQDAMLTELVEVARGAASLANLSPVAVLLEQWRHTAEVYADPALLEILRREPEGDLGAVPVPDGDR
ncbi:hypothetical protein [Catellatospora sp. NPDC049609]|uniref:hypothetical protein n=1 Tax=Catellatospora sp. NPDC049609 TaxID=3155505 RepID=UPI00341C569D